MRKALFIAITATVIGLTPATEPASAGWQKHHKTATTTALLLATSTSLTLKGEAGGVSCDVIVEFELEPGGTTGKIWEFEVDGQPTDECAALSPISHCAVHSFWAQGFPWFIHTATESSITVTTGTITTDLVGFLCPDPDFTPGTITLVAAGGERLTTSTTSVSGTLSADGPAQNVSVTGQLHVLGSITYGI